MVLALGIDSGGTQTRCLVIDETGQVVGFGVSGASKPDAVDLVIGRANLHQAMRDACAGCGGTEAIDTAFFGMGGVASDADIAVIRTMVAGSGLRDSIPIGIDHDVRIALAGGTAGQPGIALIVGTGSSCYGRNAAGESWRSGGWGYIIDDGGSGFFLGQQALMALIRAADGRGAQTALTEPVLATLGLNDVSEVMHHIYYPALNYAGIASLSRAVVQTAEAGDPVALQIVDRGCEELARMVKATSTQLGMTDYAWVVPVGGLAWASPLYQRVLAETIKSFVPQAEVKRPIAPPVVGATLLALEQLGLSLTAEVMAKIQPEN